MGRRIWRASRRSRPCAPSGRRPRPTRTSSAARPIREPFIFTTTKDDRVGPQHARKFAARMEEYGLPFYYYENTEGGHAAGANLRQAAHTNALGDDLFDAQADGRERAEIALKTRIRRTTRSRWPLSPSRPSRGGSAARQGQMAHRARVADDQHHHRHQRRSEHAVDDRRPVKRPHRIDADRTGADAPPSVVAAMVAIEQSRLERLGIEARRTAEPFRSPHRRPIRRAREPRAGRCR